jgi:hypothetical protein
MTDSAQKPTFTTDRIVAEFRGEEITIWNHLTIQKSHEVGHGLHETHHTVLAGDGSTSEKPEFITPEMDRKLQRVDVYPDVRVLDPTDEEVTLL